MNPDLLPLRSRGNARLKPTGEAGFRPTGEAGFRPTGEAGFSMVEMLMVVFILAVGLLGLTMLQAMVVRTGGGSRQLTTAVQVGQSILDAADVEARQQRLFRTMSPADTPPALSSYFGNAAVTGSYSTYGNPVNTSSTDPLDQVTIFTTSTTNTQTQSNTGKVYQFAVTITWKDSINPQNPSQTITRTITLNRMVTL